MKKTIKGVLDFDSISTAEFESGDSVVDILVLTSYGYRNLDDLIEGFYGKKVRITIETINEASH